MSVAAQTQLSFGSLDEVFIYADTHSSVFKNANQENFQKALDYFSKALGESCSTTLTVAPRRACPAVQEVVHQPFCSGKPAEHPEAKLPKMISSQA